MKKEINIQELGCRNRAGDKKAFCLVYVEYSPKLQQYTIRDVYD